MAASVDDSPELVRTVTDGDRVLGYVVIDSMIDGHSIGGFRMMPDIDEKEIRALARAMSFKYGFVGLRHGGAKAGVIGDPERPAAERCEVAENFGRAIAPLLRDRIYIPATDMGSGPEELRHLRKGAGLNVAASQEAGATTGDYTGLGVWACARAAARHAGIDPGRSSVAIEGFGKVGQALADAAIADGASVVAISTSRGALFNSAGLDVARLIGLSCTHGSGVVEHYPDAERLDRGALLELSVDILSPCASYYSIRADNVARVDARVLVPGANVPATADAERELFGRGVVCVPDFVANAGGVLGGAMSYSGVSDSDLRQFLCAYLDRRAAELLRIADERRLLPRRVAEEIAAKNIRKMKRPGEGRDLLSRVYKTLVGQYRRGRIPRELASSVAMYYFRRSLM